VVSIVNSRWMTGNLTNAVLLLLDRLSSRQLTKGSDELLKKSVNCVPLSAKPVLRTAEKVYLKSEPTSPQFFLVTQLLLKSTISFLLF